LWLKVGRPETEKRLEVRSFCFLIRNFEFGIWNLFFGIWNLFFGICFLEFGVWNLEFIFLPFNSGQYGEMIGIINRENFKRFNFNRLVYQEKIYPQGKITQVE
jgi:hypothetical protein